MMDNPRTVRPNLVFALRAMIGLFALHRCVSVRANLVFALGIVSFVLLSSLRVTAQIPADRVITSEAIAPKGQYYDVTVPNTLDLAERAKLSVRGLTRFLNPAQNYAPYGQGFFNVNPAFMSQTEIGRGEPSWGKIAESLIKAQLMCGRTEELDIEERMLKGMLQDKHIAQVSAGGPTATSRALYALIALYQVSPSPDLKAQIEAWVKAHIDLAKTDGDAAFYYDGPADPNYSYIWQAFIQGTAIRVLAEWYTVSGDQSALDMARRLANHMKRSKYWVPEAEPRAMAGNEHGHFMGHHHSYVQALMGLLWYGEAAGDYNLKEFARSGYEYMRCFGLASLGAYGEMCTTGDMTQLALKLCDTGMGDYWEDVDRYVRNHLTELQITHTSKLKTVVDQLAPHSRELNPVEETRDNVIERNIGIYLSDGTHPESIPAPYQPNARGPLMWTICCTGNCTPALYYAWESIVRCNNGIAQINLLLNRASPWLDVESYLPYEGKVVIRNKTAGKISVRIPRWADKASVTGEITGKSASPYFIGQYLVFDQVTAGDVITITFPVATITEKFSLKWATGGFWTESTVIKPEDQPGSTVYTMTFKGNTLVDISPRDTAFGYQLYERDQMRTATTAPMQRVNRFVSDQLISQLPNDEANDAVWMLK